jgi:hypothetical protein
LVLDEVTEFFNWPNTFRCIMALVLTQPQNICTKDPSGSNGQPECKADNLTTICELTLENMYALRSHNPKGLRNLLKVSLTTNTLLHEKFISFII